MSGLELFDFHGSDVRVVIGDDGTPWFVAADVCSVLELTNRRSSLALLDEDEKGVHTVDTLGGPQATATVNEPGLYSLVFRSRKPEAKAFKRWVTHDVLPAIRKTGGFSVIPQQRQPEAVALPNARELALMVIEAEDAKAFLEAQVAELQPAADAWNEVATANGSVLVGDAAKMLQNAGIDTGPVRLFKHMEALGWVFRWSSPDDEVHGPWKAKQDQIECGRLIEVPTTYVHPKTKARTVGNPQIRVTMKGVEKLHDLMGRKRLALPAK